MALRAGLLVRCGGRASHSATEGELAFLPASIARFLLPLPRLTPVPWDSAQIALVGGEVVAVLALGEPSGELLLCELDGQAIALSGLFADRVGFWPEDESGVRVDGVLVPTLELGRALRQFRSHRPSAQESRDE